MWIGVENLGENHGTICNRNQTPASCNASFLRWWSLASFVCWTAAGGFETFWLSSSCSFHLAHLLPLFLGGWQREKKKAPGNWPLSQNGQVKWYFHPPPLAQQIVQHKNTLCFFLFQKTQNNYWLLVIFPHKRATLRVYRIYLYGYPEIPCPKKQMARQNFGFKQQSISD